VKIIDFAGSSFAHLLSCFSRGGTAKGPLRYSSTT